MHKEKTVHPILRWAGDFLFQDVQEKGGITKAGIYFIRLVTYLTREFNRDLCPQKAAALAYTSVLSLVPVSALFVLYFKVAGKLDTFSDQLQGWVLQTLVAESAQNVSIYLDGFVKNMHTKTLGALGASGLVVSAYLVFRTIDRAINDIWKVRSHRSFLARFQILCTLLILVPSLMLASLYISGKFQELKILGHVQSLTAFVRTLYFMTPLVLSTFLFLGVFRFVPNTRVRWRPAIIAALLASILFESAKGGFNFYVVHIIHLNRIYGALGLIPMLLLWIYFSWIITLLGVELGYVLQNFVVLHEEALKNRSVGPLDVPLHEEWGLRIAVALARQFSKGAGPVAKEELSREVGLKVGHVEDHLSVLEKAKIVALVNDSDEPGYVFIRPVETVTDWDILKIFRSELGLSVENPNRESSPLSLRIGS